MLNLRTAGWLALAMFLASGCNLYETDKANKKVDESNDLFEEAGKLTEKADEIKAEAVKEPDAEKRKAGGKKCEKKYADAIEKLEEAEKLLKEASKLKVAKEFSDYLSKKAKQLAKVGEGIDGHAKMCVELAKDTPDAAAVEKLVKEAKDAMKEAKELSEEAEEIQEKNPDKFKN
jgi:hypothetical protein